MENSYIDDLYRIMLQSPTETSAILTVFYKMKYEPKKYMQSIRAVMEGKVLARMVLSLRTGQKRMDVTLKLESKPKWRRVL